MQGSSYGRVFDVPDNILLGVVLEVCVVDQAVVVPPAPINQSVETSLHKISFYRAIRDEY
jgi:hypothetical protein